MIHLDDQAVPCRQCKSTRAQYTMPNRGASTAYRTCLVCKCRTGIDTAADVARKVSPSLEASRAWWSNFY